MSGFVFFDLDNTLVDQTAALDAWAAAFVERRRLDPASIDWFSVKSAASVSWPQFAAQLKTHFGLDDSVDDLVLEVVADYPRLFALEPGAAEGLARLRAAGMRLAVVTNGATVMQNAKIDGVGLRPMVDAVVVSETEGLRKPERGIFERAAKALGVELGRHGWMVGDTLEADVDGGLGAGLRTVWIPHGRVRTPQLPMPEFSCATLAEAIELIERSR